MNNTIINVENGNEFSVNFLSYYINNWENLSDEEKNNYKLYIDFKEHMNRTGRDFPWIRICDKEENDQAKFMELINYYL